MAARRRQQNAHAANGKTSNNNTTTKYTKGRQKGSKEDNDSSASKSKGVNFGYAALVAGLAALCGYLHRNHVATMFENDRHFSHLSTLERELAFRTEMGLYYSYYKTIIEAPSFFTGLNEVMYDNITEYPDTINTLKRFNLYPEVVLGIGYRWYEGVMSGMNIPTKQCWEVNRGEGLSPVQSCEGLGEPSYFYVEGVFLLNGIMMAVFFLFGTYLSGSIAGGILAVLSFFYNHGECTRVQWTPPLRESHAFPFLVIELFIVTWTLRTPKPGMKHSLLIALSVISFMLPWQFAQFALMTQTVAVFGTYVLQYIDAHRVKVILIGQGLGLAVSYIFLFGNEMLLSSFFASCILAVFMVVMLEPVTELLKFRILIWAVQGVIWLVGTIGIKTVVAKVLRIADDAHIWDIFRSKFSNFKNFHTMLYTCAAEFDFMEAETPGRVLKTLLLPMCLVSVGGVLYHILKQEHKLWTTPADEEEEDSDASSEPEEGSTEQPVRKHAELLYHVFQLIAYSLMAIIIMRLKLFWTPHMCLMTSLLASQQLFGRLIKSKQLHMTLVGVLIGLMSIQGYFNLQHQWSIRGEFSNPPTEELVEWIKAATPQNAVFAGPMPTMATVKLCTLRPIVNHPHYEDAGLRARTKKVYSMYSRKPMAAVHQNMRDLQANYVILEDSWCRRRSAKGCGMAEIWDLEDVEYRDEKTPTCFKLQKNPGPYFKRVFQNSAYHVLQVLNVDS